MDNNRKITFIFNLTLYIFLCFCYTVSYLFDPITDAKVPWDRVYALSPIFSIILAFLIPLILSLFGAKLIKLFWDRFVSDLFSLRLITFQEAWSLVLIMAIIGS